MYSRVYVEITNICNMHCSFCHGHSRKPEQMDLKSFSHILDQLDGKTKYIYYHLMGEPLTHPLLPQFLQMAAQRGFLSVITTNGTLLHKRGRELIDSGLHKVSISLHSFEQNDTSVQEQYIRQAAAFASEAAAAGVIVVLRLWNRGYDDGRNDTTVDILRAALDGAWTVNTRGFRIRERLFLEWGDRFGWPDMDNDIQGSSVFCYGLRGHFGILCDGTVVPCCLDSEGILALGNIFRENITDILASPRAQKIYDGFSRRTAEEDLCQRCPYAQRFS